MINQIGGQSHHDELREAYPTHQSSTKRAYLTFLIPHCLLNIG